MVVTTPPESYLVLGNADPVGVIGGALPTRLADGREVDYWIGWPKLGWEALCQSLSEHPRTWAVLSASFLEQLPSLPRSCGERPTSSGGRTTGCSCCSPGIRHGGIRPPAVGVGEGPGHPSWNSGFGDTGDTIPETGVEPLMLLFRETTGEVLIVDVREPKIRRRFVERDP